MAGEGDRLPRKLKEVVRVGHDMTLGGVLVGSWSTPTSPMTGLPGLRRGLEGVEEPDIEEGLLKPGTTARISNCLRSTEASSSCPAFEARLSGSTNGGVADRSAARRQGVSRNSTNNITAKGLSSWE